VDGLRRWRGNATTFSITAYNERTAAAVEHTADSKKAGTISRSAASGSSA
jgi:hypothetical protein